MLKCSIMLGLHHWRRFNSELPFGVLRCILFVIMQRVIRYQVATAHHPGAAEEDKSEVVAKIMKTSNAASGHVKTSFPTRQRPYVARSCLAPQEALQQRAAPWPAIQFSSV